MQCLVNGNGIFSFFLRRKSRHSVGYQQMQDCTCSLCPEPCSCTNLKQSIRFSVSFRATNPVSSPRSLAVTCPVSLSLL